MGNPVKALELLRRAERLNPRDSKAWYTAAAVALANFATGQYEEATHSAKRSLARRPEGRLRDMPRSRLFRAALI